MHIHQSKLMCLHQAVCVYAKQFLRIKISQCSQALKLDTVSHHNVIAVIPLVTQSQMLNKLSAF